MTRSIIAFAAIILIGAGVFLSEKWQARQQQIVSRHRIAANHKPFEFTVQDDRYILPFRLDWPPLEPTDVRRQKTSPLLSGQLIVSAGKLNKQPQLNLRIEISRPNDETDRQRWNRDLKFPEYDWMSRVRTWDRDQKWLRPNLPFLLRANGIQRHQRYSGFDPGKGVDNDFAAIVVKSWILTPMNFR